MTGRIIRKLSAEEVDTLVGWAAGEGWNPGPGDAEAFHAADPEGFLGCFVDGEMAAGISAVAYDDRFGFIGLYICRAEMRGKGHGRAVWDAAMERLGHRTIGLDGVPQQQANYRGMGFDAAYRTLRMSGCPVMGDDAVGVTDVSAKLVPAARRFDRLHFPADRAPFLDRWLSAPRTALAIFHDGELRGYGVVRPCAEGSKIGPLFARTQPDADALFAALVARTDGKVHIDVPETAKGFLRLLDSLGMTPGFETARMYRGPAPAIDQACVFGISTLELG